VHRLGGNSWFALVLCCLAVVCVPSTTRAQAEDPTTPWTAPRLLDAEALPDHAIWTVEETGTRWAVLRASKGGLPRSQDVVRVHYVAWLVSSGERIADSRDARFPLTFVLGDLTAPSGIDRMVHQMRVGERRRVVFPPEQAFGALGRGARVPAGATVAYDLELVEAASAVDVAPKALVEADVTRVPVELPPAGLLGIEAALRATLKLAHRHELDGRFSESDALYTQLLDDDRPPVLAVLGGLRVLARGAQWDDAHTLLLAFGVEPSLVWAHARLAEQLGKGEHAAKLYAVLARSLDVGEPEPWIRQAVLMARADPESAREHVDRYISLVGEGDWDVSALAACARAMVLGGATESAASLLESIQATAPVGQRLDALQPVLDEIALDRVASSFVLARGPVTLDGATTARLNQAIGMVDRGEVAAGLSLLRGLRAEYPGAIELWLALGDAYQRATPAEDDEPLHHAEHAYRTAASLDSSRPGVYARLGRLLDDAYGGRRDRDARAAYEMELANSPNHAEVRCRYARVLQRMSSFEAAIDAWEDCAARVQPGTAWAKESSRALQTLQRAVPEPPELQGRPEMPSDVPEQAMRLWQKARALMARRDTGWEDGAQSALEEALAIAPEFNAARMTLASVLVETGDAVGAATVYAAVLDDDEEHIWAHLERGRLLVEMDRVPEAQSHFLAVVGEQGLRAEEGLRSARAAGPSTDVQAVALASYWLARLSFDAGDEDSARRYVGLALSLPFSDPYLREVAVDLRTTLDAPRVFWRRVSTAGFGGILLIGLAWYVRRFREIDVETFLERCPRAWPDAAVILSAIKHEVLKHNTTLLPSVADALEAGRPEAARYAAERLFGAVGEPGIIERFDRYLVKLSGLAGAHGQRLALRRDPILSPMRLSMRSLQRLKAPLLGERKMPRHVSTTLRDISSVLNGSGYDALGRLLSEMCVLPLDEAVLRHIYHRVAEEPELQGEAPVLNFELPQCAVPVRIFRADLEDIAGNLFRNALEALRRDHPLGARRVGVAVVEEVDPVTGHEHVALRFRDNALEPFTNEMLAGRYIEHGLGLALDMVSRYQGSMCIEEEPGWAKAVVVRLPRAETGDEATKPLAVS
jgi:cytochrome c-type biogenesis protein CcmH/NrfG